MASAEFAKDLVIDKAAITFHDVIGKGGYSQQVLSASLALSTGDVLQVAAKKVFSNEVKEAKVMKELDHKNIIKFYGVVIEEFDAYIIMELAENGNLRHYLDECRKENKIRLPLEVVWQWVYEGACGIRYLHDMKHSHRDIKSLNYLIARDFTVKLGDLGLAKELDLTQETSGMRGTCRWMAPEVIKEQRRSVKSDVFSFGTVVWEIFTTDIPYADKRGDFQVMNAICSGKRPSIPDDCPQQLRELIEICWQDDYNQRPDMSEICQQLEQRIQEEQSTVELSKQLQKTAIDDDCMDTMTEEQSEETDEKQAAQIAIDCAGSAVPPVSKVFKTREEMPLIKRLFAREGLSSSEYISCDSSTPTSGSVAMYKMCDVPRGVCLIINNVDFSEARRHGHTLLHDRDGSDVDREVLCDIFTKFKFTVVCKNNLSSEAMDECFEEISRQDHTSANAFVCCILTHGKVGQLAGCEGKYVTIQGIVNKFTKEECPSLARKPKLFFIQACQGVESQEEHDLQIDVGSVSPTGIGVGLDETTPNPAADFLISFATVPGHVSYRNTQLGSWFIGVLVDKLNKLHEKEDLMSILTEVNRKLSKESTKTLGKNYVQMSLPVTTLRKKVYFTMWERGPKTTRSITQATCELDFQGGKLSLPAIGASLEVPEGALPKDIAVVNMSLSLHQDLDDHPPIDADHLMITPIIRCGPEGVEFNKPVMLRLPHSVQSFKEGAFELSNGEDIHLWFKSSKDDWQKLPSRIPKGKNQPFWLKQITQNAIILQVEHFCEYGLSASQPQTMKIMMFMQPSRICADTSAIYVSAYAVQESLVEKIKEDEKKSNASIMCAKEHPLTLLPNEKALGITLKKVKPSNGWQPTSTQNKIKYEELQKGNERSRCEFCFERISEENPTTIRGQYDAEQEKNKDHINNFHFDINMFRVTSYGSQPTSPVVTLPRLVPDSEPVNTLQLIPKKDTVQDKLAQLEQWRQMLHRPEVREMLKPILTENMVDFFTHMHQDDKQEIQNAFKSKFQSDAAEVFLKKIVRLGNDEWHREVIEALASSGCKGYCQYLGEVYQRCLDEQAMDTSKDGTVFCPPKPKQMKLEDSRIQTTHLCIWTEVVAKEIGNLCKNLNPDNLLRVLEKHIPDFVTKNQSEYQAKKAQSDNRAFRWLLERLSQCGDPSWPGALEKAIQGSPVQDTTHKTFWDIHSQKKYSSCPCEQVHITGDAQASLEGASSST